MKVAKIIVDVKSMQTDKPYSYLIPEKLMSIVQKGVQVAVPFGKGNRLLQGFVVDVVQEYNCQDLKYIKDIEDYEPVLNQELLALADYMKDETFSFKIKCLQTMLPTALKRKYNKILIVKTEKAFELIGSHEITYNEAIDILPPKQIKDLLENNDLDVEYRGKSKTNIKKQAVIQKKISNDQIEQELLKVKNAPKQKQILEILKTLSIEDQITIAFLKEHYQINRSHLKAAENKKWLLIKEVEVYRQIKNNYTFEYKKVTLNEQQQAVVNRIKQDIGRTNQIFLLEGITGSGKTEVYLNLMKQVIDQSLSCLLLVPEITLTPQMVSQIIGRFGDQVAVMHSGLSDGERYDEWRKINRNDVSIVVGARSAIFAPLTNLGLIIIDEEHEGSYKQEEVPKYDTIDIAKWRGKYHNCPVLLGSATPSLESMARAVKGNYELLKLTKRANPKARLPKVSIIDLTDAHQIKPMISTKLYDEIAKNLHNNEQSILFLNRRGYSSFMLCKDCGHVLECPNCSVSLTMHRSINKMKCHYCGHEELIPNSCPICQSKKIEFYGMGTQKVEEYLQELFPQAKIARMDVDTTRRKGDHEKILSKVKNHEVDILIGTQMIAKGLDFPKVTLVGVLNADNSLNIPDFRASERTFQLLTQVSGRAGRSDIQGRVYIQTYNPKHYAIQYAANQNYGDFFKYEMKIRHLGNYSPYFYSIQIVVGHHDDQLALLKSNEILERLQDYLNREVHILGPTKTNIERIKNQYYYQIIIKYKDEPLLLSFMKELVTNLQYLEREGYQIKLAKNPNHFM